MVRTMAQGAQKLTYEHYLLFPDDGRRHELIDGEHVVAPAPHARHQRLLGNVFVLLRAFVEERGLGRVYFAPLDVILSDLDVVQPDLVFIGNARLAQLDAVLHGPPDLAVEVASPGSRRQDEVLKRTLYARAGVAEYWLVDPEVETVKVFRAREGAYGRPELLSLTEGDVLRTELLPGMEIPLAAVFAE